VIGWVSGYATPVPYKDRAKQRRYQRERLARARRDWLTENGPCVRCGSSYELEVDHVDPNEKVAHSVWSWAPERRAAELAKCQVLCRSCHQTKTARENRARNGGLRHGTEHMYLKYGCRCNPCRTVRNHVRAKRRASRKALGLPAK
jgi:hypothetical protein